MKKVTLKERKEIKQVLLLVKDSDAILNYLHTIDKKSFSSIKRSFHALKDIIVNHGEKGCIDRLIRYQNCKSVKDKLLIRYGEDAVEKYNKSLSNRPKPEAFSIFTIDYWIKRKKLSIEDAKLKVAEIQSRNAKRRSKGSYKNFAKKLKHSLEYWTHRGYSLEEAEQLRLPYLKVVMNDLSSYIERYGESIGIIEYEKRIEKYKKSMIKNRHSRKSAGYVSKESLSFFIKLYKFCRKLGIKREDIYFGVDGSREYFIRKDGVENTGRFFDFSIPKLNLVIEYNGTFWHPRDINSWKNPWISYDDAMLIENEKKDLCVSRGFDLHYVWSDDILIDKLNELFVIIKERYNTQYETR